MSPSVIELRQYTLHHSGRRDDLTAPFEREFLETQEAEGIALIGQFVDLDDPNRFVWLEGLSGYGRAAGVAGTVFLQSGLGGAEAGWSGSPQRPPRPGRAPPPTG